MARRDIDRLQGEIEELFADLWQVPRFTGIRHGFRPAVDCFLTSDPPVLTVVVELPGVESDSVRVALGERALTVSGERPRPRITGQVYQQMEIEYGPFERTIRLAADIDEEAASAGFERGLLTITLPIVEHRPRAEPVAILVRRIE
jgi:HSP20 family protein